MAAAADKARFFLEQSVPELKEYEKKKIFSKVYSREPGFFRLRYLGTNNSHLFRLS